MTSSLRPAGTRGRRSSWVALAGILLLAVNLRAAVTSVPPVIERMQADLHLTPLLLGLLGSLAPIAFAASGLLGAALLRRYPAEHIAVGALAVMAAGQLARPFAPQASLFLLIGLFVLLAMGVSNVILPALVKAWFPGRIAPVTAGYTTMLAVGTSLPALLAVPLATLPAQHGWRLSLAVWSLTSALVVPLWWTVGRHPRALPLPAAQTQPVDPADQEVGASQGPRRARLPVHRSRIAHGLAMMFVGNSLNLYTMFTWLPSRLLDARVDEAQAGLQLAILAGVGVLPSLAMPLLATRVRSTAVLSAGCVALFVAGYLGLWLAPTTATTVWSVLAGVGGGSFPLVLTLIGLRSATPATAGAVSAFTQTIGYTGAATGPLLFGLLHDATDGWTAPFLFLLATLGLLLVGGVLSATPTTVDEQLRAQAHAPAGRPR